MSITQKQNILVITFSLICSFSIVSCDQMPIGDYLSSEEPEVQAPKKQSSKSQKKKVNKKAVPANALARVNDWFITKEDFENRLKLLKEAVPDYDIEDLDAKRNVLEELIRQQVLVAEAKKQGIQKKKEVREALEEFKNTLFVREIAQNLTKDINVSEYEARQFYDENKEDLLEPAEFKVREIVVKDRLKATELSMQILKGGDFNQLAKDNSISKSAEKGGDLGFITEVPFEEMGRALLKLKKGEISTVFEGPEGFYLVKLEEKKGGNPVDFDKIKEQLIENLKMNKQQKAVLDFINKAKQNLVVEVKEELLK